VSWTRLAKTAASVVPLSSRNDISNYGGTKFTRSAQWRETCGIPAIPTLGRLARQCWTAIQPGAQGIGISPKSKSPSMRRCPRTLLAERRSYHDGGFRSVGVNLRFNDFRCCNVRLGTPRFPVWDHWHL
jgi:hypothetical protein